MVYDRTLYDLLEIEPNATQEEIIRAIRIKSLEHHPDRGGSHEMMQKVNAAREILTNPQKRSIYDKYGFDVSKFNTENHRDESSEFPSSFIDILNLFNERPWSNAGERRTRGNDSKYSLRVSLEELYSGTTKNINFTRKVVCTDCDGTGTRDRKIHECSSCRGAGFKNDIFRGDFMVHHIQRPCSSCKGTGNQIDFENLCKSCHGQKLFEQNKTIDINIPHGTQDGEIIKFVGEGNQTSNGDPGSLYVIIQQEPHPYFLRKNDDLVMNMEINLTESLCGFQRLIKLLDGRTIAMKHPHGKPILPNSNHRLKDYGMPNRRMHTNGDLIIQFDVKFPPNNFIRTEDELRLLESILPPKMQINLNCDTSCEQVEMAECDPLDERSHEGLSEKQFEFDGESAGASCVTH